MKAVFNMVHNNPGEPEFSTSFDKPQKLKKYGYNGQVFTHIHTTVSYEDSGYDVFPKDSVEEAWLLENQMKWRERIRDARETGISILSHIDLFVFPKRLVEVYREEICDKATGRIDYTSCKVYELLSMMFRELFELYPELDGFFIRLGETYLYDLPYHMGNGPSLEKDEYGGNVVSKDAQLRLIRYLRDEVCIKYDKKIYLRTWDCFNDRFHANPDYYLEVTDQIEPHKNLVFSIKHTALDFWRRVRVNECLGIGKHKQLVEIQAQREYEGKGAYPCYVMNGIIDYFPENKVRKGLQDFVDHLLYEGVFVWARGGGWFGPYIDEKNEFWSDINAYVIGKYASDTNRSELQIFNTYLKETLGLESQYDQQIFRDICILSQEAILKGRYCEVYDQTLEEITFPVNLWMRDDRLGGMERLEPVFRIIFEQDGVEAALKEKEEAVKLWMKVKGLFGALYCESGENELMSFIGLSIDYGLGLFSLIEAGWQVLLNGYIGGRIGSYDIKTMKHWIKEFYVRYDRYLELEAVDQCPSLYQLNYFALPDEPDAKEGLGASVAYYSNRVINVTERDL